MLPIGWCRLYSRNWYRHLADIAKADADDLEHQKGRIRRENPALAPPSSAHIASEELRQLVPHAFVVLLSISLHHGSDPWFGLGRASRLDGSGGRLMAA